MTRVLYESTSEVKTVPCRQFFCAWLRLRTSFFKEDCEMSFAETFKTARIAKKLTQQQIADELSLDRSAISHYEIGKIKPHFDNINKICELLDLTYEQIFKE